MLLKKRREQTDLSGTLNRQFHFMGCKQSNPLIESREII